MLSPSKVRQMRAMALAPVPPPRPWPPYSNPDVNWPNPNLLGGLVQPRQAPQILDVVRLAGAAVLVKLDGLLALATALVKPGQAAKKL